MAGRTVTTPGGDAWRVRRVWAPRLGCESLWDRFRRRTRVSRRVANEAGDMPDPGCAADLLDDAIAIVVIVAFVVFVLLVAIPLLVAIVDVLLLALLTLLGIGARIVFRRPWVVAARALVPVPVDARDEGAWPSDTVTTELRRHTWRIVGWRASGDMVDAVANALAHGNPLRRAARCRRHLPTAGPPRPTRGDPVPLRESWHPAWMVELLTGGAGETPVHDAATVVLVRDGDAGLECLMLRKTKGQAFGGLWVFPGGRVEDGDGSGLDGARAAAVREAEEETGLVLSAADLVPFAHWIPPAEAPRRYATWFFLGGLPEGAADVVVDGGEIGDHVWTPPAAAIERHAAGEIKLLPPTWVSLQRIADPPDVATALADVAVGRVDHFSTHIADLDGVLVSLWAPDAAYETGDLAAPGPRHRLVMDPAGWRYERSG